MMNKMMEDTKLNWHEIKATLHLDKVIYKSKLTDLWQQGHYSDYLNGIQAFVALRAQRASQLLLWDSSTLISHCTYNDALQVSFHVSNDMATKLNVEAWSGNNGFILRKSKERCDLSYYFSLLHSHAFTGELAVSPCFYFIDNPDFNLSAEVQSNISELLKIDPIRIPVNENQVICFDKFHYQMAYNPDFFFIRKSS